MILPFAIWQGLTLDQWLRDNYPYLYGNDSGETEYWKDLDSAKYFIEERLIRGNINLTPLQKEQALAASQIAYDQCYTWYNPFDAASEVVCYYNGIAVSFPPIVQSSDPNINTILGLSTEGAVKSTEADETGLAEEGRPEGEKTFDFSKVPWWAWAAGALLIAGRFR